MPSTEPRISVIIPTFNESANLQKLLPLLFKTCSSENAEKLEIIVSDGGSSDDTVAVAHAHQCLVLQAPRGRGAQLRCAAERAQGTHLWFLHADSQVSEHWDTAITKHPFCAARLRFSDLPFWKTSLLEIGVQLRCTILRDIPYGDQAYAVRREVYDAVGGFEAIPLFEDVRFAQAIREHYGTWPIGPHSVTTSGRKYQREGFWRRIIHNWKLRWAHSNGTPPEQLAKQYYP